MTRRTCTICKRVRDTKSVYVRHLRKWQNRCETCRNHKPNIQCLTCCDLPHRREQPRCRKCRQPYADERPEPVSVRCQSNLAVEARSWA